MRFKQPDGEAVWAEWQASNTDGYGQAILKYAQAWAECMEVELAAGNALEAVAKQTSHKANSEGITGFMYNAAVVVLSQCWEHGEALRKWHNLDVQVQHEGERANEDGGILNAAIMTLKT